MNPSRSFVAVFLNLVAAAYASAAWAGPILFPEKEPVVTFTVPTGWKTNIVEDGTFTTTPDAGDEFAVAFTNMPYITDDGHAERTLPLFAKGMGEAAGIADPKPSAVKEIKLGSREPMTALICEVRGSSSSLGENTSVTTYIVKNTAGKYVGIAVIADAKSQSKYDVPTLVMLNSLATVR